MSRKEIKRTARTIYKENLLQVGGIFGCYLFIITVLQWLIEGVMHDWLIDRIMVSAAFSNSMPVEFILQVILSIIRLFLMIGLLYAVVHKDFRLRSLFIGFQSNRACKLWAIAILLTQIPLQLLFFCYQLIAFEMHTGKPYGLLLLLVLLFYVFGILYQFIYIVNSLLFDDPVGKGIKKSFLTLKANLGGLIAFVLSFGMYLILAGIIIGLLYAYSDFSTQTISLLASPAMFGIGLYFIPYFYLSLIAYLKQLLSQKE